MVNKNWIHVKSDNLSNFKMLWDDAMVPLSFRQHIQRSLIRRISAGYYPLDYGYIIFGPPGTGKTSITKGIAKQLDWEYVYLSPQSFVIPKFTIEEAAKERFREITKYVERKAKKIKKRNAFWGKKNADGYPPVNIVFVFDEIDELVVTRDEGADRQTRLSTTMMLPLFQKLRNEAEKYGFVFFVLTNHIERFDSAITRKGRFDLILPLGTPDYQGRFLLFKQFVHQLSKEYYKNFYIEIRTGYDLETENGDIFPVETTDFSTISRASARLSLEDIQTVCRKVIEHELNMQPTIKSGVKSGVTILYLHTNIFMDWIHKFKIVADQNPEIDKFHKDLEIYSRGSTIYPKIDILPEKIEHEFSSLRINHNFTYLGSKWKKNVNKYVVFSFTNVSVSHSIFVGQIKVDAIMNNKIIAFAEGDKDQPVAAGVTSDYYILKLKPKKIGKLNFKFTIHGKFIPYGIEEAIEKGSAEIFGTLVYNREVRIV